MDQGLRPRTMPDTGLYLYKAWRFDPTALNRDPEDPGSEKHDDLHEVRVMDNDYNTYQEVMEITMVALGLDEQEAFAIAWEVDHRGSCMVAEAPQAEAESIAHTIRRIGIEAQVNPVTRITH
jgi:ATP-dependent Clp protease adapter protein ClpS